VPDGVRLVPVESPAEVDLVVAVHNEVFGIDHSWLRREMLARLATPEAGAAVLAMAGDRPVCSARVEFHQGTDFASLWGGGTLPEWRGRGIYRALVGYRARLAAERGYRYLQVDSSPDSQPILGRLGFVRLTTTTPYVWAPPATPAGR
jgi:GNAT superfamily N-acetyltransferase